MVRFLFFMFFMLEMDGWDGWFVGIVLDVFVDGQYSAGLMTGGLLFSFMILTLWSFNIATEHCHRHSGFFPKTWWIFNHSMKRLLEGRLFDVFFCGKRPCQMFLLIRISWRVDGYFSFSFLGENHRPRPALKTQSYMGYNKILVVKLC